MGIELRIEELVLRGFAAEDRHRIAEAAQTELARLMSAEGRANFPKAPLSLDRVDAGEIKIQAGAKPEAAGAAIARAVYRGLQPRGMRQQGGVARSRPGRGAR